MYRNQQWLKTKYITEDLLMQNIANLCGVQRQTISYWLKKFNIPCRSHSDRHKGTKNGRWKGGRQFHKAFKGGKGYILVLHNGKRYREHRLVVEKHLGRKLLKNEIVHHKDGNPINNNIRNLQLFPSLTEHQRFEDSLNVFAKKILFGKDKPNNHSKLLSLFKKVLSKNGQDIST